MPIRIRYMRQGTSMALRITGQIRMKSRKSYPRSAMTSAPSASANAV